MGMFAATFGVALYSNIDIVSSMCMLVARGAVVSMLCVVFILPALLMLLDKVIGKTTLGMKPPVGAAPRQLAGANEVREETK